MTIRSAVSALGLVAGLAIALAAPAASAAGGIKGFWRTGDGRSVIEILDCTNGICGRIAGLPPDAPATDVHNPDEGKRGQALCKLIMLHSFTQVSDTEWEDGTIYDPKSGKTYDAKMHLTGPDTLDLRGYVGISLLGRTDSWTRVQPGSFKAC
ncbi:DUF2147 domain-containing protein [Inquilinus limosus]|uniref:DUF2147 domain-containing protein n=1 Tax=Inquilinus limosus TaxID=171674 RepID=A0A211ZJZ0_9PROT|nr:DUF2147 domain-containing protein [Inquilinus limosus]OWJ65506.1 hypothetical protein BWR60_19100 [Inquilinus limosus]